MYTPDPHRNETITPEALEYLQKILAADLEVYNFVVQRFYLTIKKVVEYRANNHLEDTEHLHLRDDHRNSFYIKS